MKLEILHYGKSAYNPSVYYKFDNRLIRFEVCTPNFNDYGEWRLTIDNISNDTYEPGNNTAVLEVLDGLKDFDLTTELVTFLNDMGILFQLEKEEESTKNDKAYNSITEKYTNGIYDFTHYDEFCMGMVDGEMKLCIEDDYLSYEEWEKQEDRHIFHKFMAPILNNIVETLMK